MTGPEEGAAEKPKLPPEAEKAMEKVWEAERGATRETQFCERIETVTGNILFAVDREFRAGRITEREWKYICQAILRAAAIVDAEANP